MSNESNSTGAHGAGTEMIIFSSLVTISGKSGPNTASNTAPAELAENEVFCRAVSRFPLNLKDVSWAPIITGPKINGTFRLRLVPLTEPEGMLTGMDHPRPPP
jgi:hypothetical protein